MGSPSKNSKAIDDFMLRTRPGAAGFLKEYGNLRDKGIAPDPFAHFCHAFAEGLKSVFAETGTAPSEIAITNDTYRNEKDPPVSYPKYQDGKVIIPRDFIIECLTPGHFNEKLKGLEGYETPEQRTLNRFRAVAMYGVEEAWHAHQHRKGTSLSEREAEMVVQRAWPDFKWLTVGASRQR